MKILQFTIPVGEEQTVIVQEDSLPYFYPHLHRHKETQITWIQKGTGTLLINDYVAQFEAGDIYIIGSNQPHLFKSDPHFFENEVADAVQTLTLFFHSASFLGQLMQLPEMKNINKFLETNTASLKVPPQYMDAVSAKMTAIKDRKDALRLTALLELLDFLANIKDYKTGTSTAHSYVISETEGLRMNDIYQYTMAHYKEDIALETIARIAHLTPQAFCRYFKKHTRKTYITFLNDIRIAEACSKIINSKGASMSAVAYSTGFNNVVTFNRLFKKTMGCSPSEYLRVYDKKTH